MATNPTDDKVAANLPTYVRPELEARLLDLTLMDDLLAGTRRMHARRSLYIRQWAEEKADIYGIRSRCEQVFEGLGRTLSAAVGMLFSKPPELEWNQGEAAIKVQWENLDGMGTAGHVFVKRFAEACLRDGVGVIVVDYPKPPRGEDGQPITVSSDMDETLGLRPRWSSYPRANVLSWRYNTVNNQNTLTQIVLAEPSVKPEGRFGVVVKTRWRHIFLGLPKNAEPNPDGTPARPTAHYEVWEATVDDPNKPENFFIAESGEYLSAAGEPMPFLPVAVATVGKPEGDPLVASIPLLGVAWANLGHWQIASNLRFYRDLVAFPQPTLLGQLAKEQGYDTDGNLGMVPGSLKIGPLVVVHLSSDGEVPSKFEWTAPPVAAFAPLVDGATEKMEAMAALGMSFLDRDKRAAETAEAKRMDATAENATLATGAQGIEDCVNYAFVIHAWYEGIEKEQAPVIRINRDYESTAMEAAVMGVWINAVQNADIPVRVMLEAWKAGGRLPPDVDIDELEWEILAAIAAKQAQAAEIAQAQAAARQPPPRPGEPKLRQEDIDPNSGE